MFTARTTTVTTAGTAVQLFDTANSYADSIRIKALSTNTGLVYIGMSDVDSTKGFALVKGEEITRTTLIQMRTAIKLHGQQKFIPNLLKDLLANNK